MAYGIIQRLDITGKLVEIREQENNLILKAMKDRIDRAQDLLNVEPKPISIYLRDNSNDIIFLRRHGGNALYTHDELAAYYYTNRTQMAYASAICTDSATSTGNIVIAPTTNTRLYINTTEANTLNNVYEVIEGDYNPTASVYQRYFATAWNNYKISAPNLLNVNLDDYVIVNDIDLYQNNSDNTLARVQSHIDLCLVTNFASMITPDRQETIGDIQLFSSLFNIITVGTQYTDNANKIAASIYPSYKAQFVLNNIAKDDDMFYISTSAIPNDVNNSTTIRIIVKKSFLTNYLNWIGIPWTTDQTLASSGTIEDLKSTGYDPEAPLPQPPGQPDDTTEEWGGDGDNTNDPFELVKPSLNPFYSTCKQYVLNSKIASDFVKNTLYNGSFLQNIDLAFNNPKEGFVSLVMYPFDFLLHDPDNVTEGESIICGKVKSNEVAITLKNEYNSILDIGTYDLKPYFGSFLDITNTELSLFVPYVGWVNLDTANFFNRRLHVRYVVDFTTGNCSVFITSIGNDGVERLEKIANGVMGVEVPVISSNYNEKLKSTASSLISTAISAGAAYVTGGASLALGAGIASSALGIASQQNQVNKGGAWGGMLSLWQPQQLILQITRPEKSEASSFKAKRGYRANITKKLSEINGYVECNNPDVSGIPADYGELEEIRGLLANGIYIN